MTFRSFCVALLLLLASGGVSRAADDGSTAGADVRRLLAAQVEAWNRGDLDSFVLAYAEDALFVSTSGTTRGRSEVLARYKRRYADVKAMGRLTLDIEELRVGAGGTPSAVRVVAKWTLEREGSPPRSGPTLLFLERRDGRWWITEDASMESEPAG